MPLKISAKTRIYNEETILYNEFLFECDSIIHMFAQWNILCYNACSVKYKLKNELDLGGQILGR